MLESYVEDLKVGQVELSRARTVTETDIVTYCMFSGDWFPVHCDVVYSEASIFGERIAPGLMILAIASGLSGASDSMATIAQYGIDRVRYPAPTFIGDTIRLRSTIVNLQDRDDTSAIVELAWEVVNQNDTVTCSVHLRLLQAKRGGDD
jgi:acyl dehydratase